MGRFLITGSSAGLGLMAGQRLLAQGHQVVLHARNKERAEHVWAATPSASAVVIGDLSSIAETRDVADQANRLGRFDAVIHNAGVGDRERRVETVDGLEHIFAINVLAPYLLTALIEPPQRLVYLSSGMHLGGDPDFTDLQWSRRRWNGSQAYSDSKLLDTMLAFAVARLWPAVRSNAVDPGWVPTRMGGPGAPDDLERGAETQVWLAVSQNASAMVTGAYFHHNRQRRAHPAAHDVAAQERLFAFCEAISRTPMPRMSEKA
jgi:NAD(P)-dependent dehydrogenase (short-subunit alcohol dehydrogenase family)